MYKTKTPGAEESAMKVYTDAFPIKKTQGEDTVQKKNVSLERKNVSEDRVTISDDTVRLVIEENKSAADTELVDFKKAEAELHNLKKALLAHADMASDIHQPGVKRVLFTEQHKNT
jgi:hypothetical protein